MEEGGRGKGEAGEEGKGEGVSLPGGIGGCPGGDVRRYEEIQCEKWEGKEKERERREREGE